MVEKGLPCSSRFRGNCNTHLPIYKLTTEDDLLTIRAGYRWTYDSRKVVFLGDSLRSESEL